MSSESFFCGLPVYSLKEILSYVPLPANVNREKVSSKWRCIIAPRIDLRGKNSSESSAALLTYLDAGIPVLYDAESSLSSGSSTEMDGISLVTSEAYNSFEKPQIAVKSGWGAPKTARDHSHYHLLVRSFSNIFDLSTRKALETDPALQIPLECEDAEDSPASVPLSESVLELQLFHREEGCKAPPYAEALTWPECLTHKVVCDVATVATQEGFRRWWDMNDSGELLLESVMRSNGIPLPLVDQPSSVQRSKMIMESLFATLAQTSCSDGALPQYTSTASRLCIFGSRGSYDFFIHDDASLASGCVTCVDIFEMTDEELPKSESLLPMLIVCVLEGGGPMLLQPPNLSCTQVFLQSCVTLEQRAISYLWLDEVSYFLLRCRLWSSDPMIYPFIEEDLQECEYLRSVLIPLLCELFRDFSGNHKLDEVMRRRIVASLFAIAKQESHYGLDEGSRKSLGHTLTRDNEEMKTVLKSRATNLFRAHLQDGVAAASIWSLEEMLEYYWDTTQLWPKAGCVLRVPTFFPEGRPVHWEASSFRCVPVVYPQSKFTPVYGCEEATPELTLKEYLTMKKMEPKAKELHAYLSTRKAPVDDLLDELF